MKIHWKQLSFLDEQGYSSTFRVPNKTVAIKYTNTSQKNEE